MKLVRCITLTTLAVLGTLAACSSKDDTAARPVAPTVAIVPFRTVGAAQSGQYGLQLSEFSTYLATEFGARSDWQVAETQRIDVLSDEQAFEVPPVSASTPAAQEDGGEAAPVDEATPAGKAAATATDPAQWAATFPSANYVLLGQITGFDVSPFDARAAGQTLAMRENRIRSRIDVRIVDVHTRAWIASRSVIVDERLGDDAAAETQITQAMSIAAEKVVTAVLLAVAKEFQITELKGERVTLSGGSQQGVRAGQVFKVEGAAATDTSAQIRIVEAFADHAVATIVDGRVAAGDRVAALPVEPANVEMQASAQGPRIAIGRFFAAGSDPDSKSNSPFVSQVQQDLLARFHHYSGLRVVEDRTGALKDLLAGQALEDLSKGRDPGLPMGSLHGVDYLIFGNIRATGIEKGRREEVEMFGAKIIDDIPPRLQFDATVYILDVSRGEYITASDVSLDLDMQGRTEERMIADLSRAVAAEIFAKSILEIRPLAVVEVRDDEVVLNHTSAAGLAVGDRFTAMSRGEDRLDPNTKTWMRNVGGKPVGEIEISGFDVGGWAHAKAVDGLVPPAGALLVPRSADDATVKRQKLNW